MAALVQYDNMGDGSRHKTIRAKRLSLCCIIIALCIKKENRGHKKLWCKKWLENRSTLGSHMTLLREQQDDNYRELKNYMRMDPDTFHRLL